MSLYSDNTVLVELMASVGGRSLMWKVLYNFI